LFWIMTCFCQAFGFICSYNFNCTILNEIEANERWRQRSEYWRYFSFLCFSSTITAISQLYLVIILVLHNLLFILCRYSIYVKTSVYACFLLNNYLALGWNKNFKHMDVQYNLLHQHPCYYGI
ncbi:hypothetical protein T05_13310, partial [Trichinella murrelli]